MKKTLLTVFLGLLMINCSRSSDEKPQDTLPPITQTGANTAGCMVNGKVLIPKNGDQSIGGQPLYGLNLNSINSNYYFVIKNFKTNNFIYFFIQNNNLSGEFVINQSDGYASPMSQNTQMYLQYEGKIYISSNNAGKIVISRFDYPFMSGTFYAELYNKENPNEKILITDGRFDINRQTLNK